MVFRRPSHSPPLQAGQPPARQRRWLHALLGSLLLHAGVVTFGLPRLLVQSAPDILVTYLPDEDSQADSDKATDNAVPLKPLESPPEPERRLAVPIPPKPPDPVKPLEVIPLPKLPMVDQDQFPDESDNAKARFLAQKNHRAVEDVQAKERTMVRPLPADSPSAPPGVPTPAPAQTAPEKRVAELLPTPPQVAPQPSRTGGTGATSPLAMREPGAEVREPVPGGDLNPLRPGATKAAGKDGPPSIAPSRLGPRDYDQIVGSNQAEAERRAAALAEHGSAPGPWDKLMKKQAALHASLENFVGNVRTGNQSELGTRKHPFAAFITAMHRQIHHQFADGFLATIDYKGQNLYPDTLVSAIEISINPDGKVDELVIVKHSGSLPFDTAALDSVMSAAPFPDPPDAIKSRDGKVYLTWYFHRDGRQCHPNYVGMHILTSPPKKKPGSVSPKEPVSAPPRGPESERPRFARNDGPTAAPTEKPSAESAASAASATGASSRSASKISDEAREAAERWLTAYQKADVRWLAGVSALPFTAAGKQVADDGPALRAFFKEMLAEGVAKRERVSYYTAAQIRAKLGRMPRGGEESDMVFAVVELAGEDLILLLVPTDRGYSVAGIDR